jgi:hypothetical protein
MDDIKTVDDYQILDPLYSKQKEGVSKMRASLLACSSDNSTSMVNAIQNITVMRIYHQLSRIIKYTELMDKLEDKLYESIENTIDNVNSDPATMMMLLNVQEKLQKSMIESHKLLQPYMDVKEFAVMDLVQPEDNHSNITILDPEKRDGLRTKASNILKQLNAG